MTQDSPGRSGASLRVMVTGNGLPPDVVKRIEQAVQRTVLQELLGLNLGPGFRVDLALEPDLAKDGGTTQGIYIQSDLPG